MDWFPVAVLLVSILAAATASVVGFGIGSLLTPLLAAQVGMTVAVAAVAVPHAIATGLRSWRLRHAVDRRVLVRFGILSAAGGLTGAVLYTQLASVALTHILGGLLVLTAVAHLGGLAARWHPRGATVTLLGLGSGFFGGVAGNQGGLRAAAMTTFRLSPSAFVGTATATGLMVDAARTPVYLWRSGAELVRLWPLIGVAVLGVVVGTLAGERVLLGLSPERFSRIVAAAIGILGVWLLLGAA